MFSLEPYWEGDKGKILFGVFGERLFDDLKIFEEF